MGCSLVCGVKFIGLLSTLLAAAVVGVSVWLLKDSYEEQQSTVGQAIGVLGGFTKSVGFDPELNLRIKIGVSAATLAAGALQLITSLFLLLCSSSKGGRVSARLWLFVSLFVILATAGSFVCIVRKQAFVDEVKDRDANHQLKAYLLATGADAIFLFIFSFITGAFGCRSGGTQA